MPTGTFEVEVPVDLPANELWKALKDQNNVLPRIIPLEIASIQVVEGEGGVGSVRVVRYGPGKFHTGQVSPENGYVKEKIVKMDAGDRCMVTEEIEGGHLEEFGFKKWVQTLQIIPTGPDSSKVHAVVNYEGGTDEAANRSNELTKQGLTGTFKALAKHIEETLGLKPNA